MLFRRELPTITEDRCRGCRMLGGVEVVSQAQAELYSEMWHRPVAIGDHVEEDPCVPAAELAVIEKERNQPCPRVVLSPDNWEALELLGMVTHPSTKALVQPLLDALGLSPADRLEIIRRVAWVRMHPKMQAQAEAEALHEALGG